MFVSLDMDNMVFLHKHHEQDTCGLLAWIEAPERSIAIENSDNPNWIARLTELEMSLLYKNTTGVSIMAGRWVEVQRQMIAGLVERMKPTLALQDEAEAQAKAVEDDLYKGIGYKYALGAKVPAKQVELLPLKAAPLSEAQADAAARRVPPPPPPGAVVPPAPPAPVATPDEGKLARRGGVRQVVYAAATAAWDAAGKGQSATWEQVRAKLIEQLVNDGYHNTTVRIKLSEWAKINNP